MILKDKIPENFYSLFRTRNTDYYMKILIGLYEENNGLYTSLGLTFGQCRQIVMEKLMLFTGMRSSGATL